MRISDFQNLMKDLYFHQDSDRGIDKTFRWLVEEGGELANLLKYSNYDKRKVQEEMADIFAWLGSLANLLQIDLEKACINKYPHQCIKCNSNPCQCGVRNGN